MPKIQKSLGKIYPKIEGDALWGFDKISFIKSDTAFSSSNVEGQVRYDTSEKRLKLWNGSAEVAVISNSVQTADIADAAVTKTKLSYEVKDVTVSAGTSSGTTTVTSGSIIIGYYPAGNQDQFVDNISVSGTTLTVTLAANATADNIFKVVLLKA